MKQKQRKILTDISFDVLRHIMLCISKSSGGAKNLTRTLTACRVFKEISEDPVILKAVTFDDVKLSKIHESFYQCNGLLFRCIRAGNLSALETAMKYLKTLIAAFKNFRRDFKRAIKKLRISAMKVRIVNTRARWRAFELASNDCQIINDSTGKSYEKAQILLKAMDEGMRSLRVGA